MSWGTLPDGWVDLSHKGSQFLSVPYVCLYTSFLFIYKIILYLQNFYIGKIILERILGKQGGRLWTGCIWLRLGSTGRTF